MVLFNTLIERVNTRIHRYLAFPHRQPTVGVVLPGGDYTKNTAAANPIYFGTLVVTGSYRSDGEVIFRS